jgi:Leucine-rich repeat (LRR) protein
MFSPFASGGMEASLAARSSHSQLGRWMFLAPKLTELSLRARLPMWLSPEIGAFMALRDLDLAENWMAALPAQITKCTALQTLDASSNKLEALPEKVGRWTRLRKLDLHTNALAALPDSFCGLTALTELDLHANQLVHLPEGFAALTALRTLTLHNNCLEGLPAMHGTEVRHVTLHHNRLESLPAELVAGLGGAVDLSHNRFREVPACLYRDTTHALNMCENALCGFAPGLTAMAAVTVLDLGHNQLARLPDELCALRTLRHLDVNNNVLEVLPERLGSLTALRVLHVQHNRLATLPESLAAAPGATIHCHHNSIVWLPQPLVQSRSAWHLAHNRVHLDCVALPNVTLLDVEANGLTELPPSIGNMVGLLELRAGHNHLVTLPVEIGSCASLRRLDLCRNALVELPPALARCAHLAALVLNGNPITALPAEMAALDSLVEVSCDEHQWAISEGVTERRRMSFAAVLSSNRERRDGEVTVASVLAKCRAWSAETWEEADLAALAPDELRQAAEWMRRLANTRDFATCSEDTQSVAAAILRTVVTDAEFRAMFFAQVGANLERCGDRAAMSFNEIYTAWRVHRAGAMAPRARLDLCVAAAKTNALRGLVAQVASGSESVEAYLYAETALKEQLGLLTFASGMLYGGIGRVDLVSLARGVEDVWEAALFDMLEGQALFPDFPARLSDEAAALFEGQMDAVEDALAAGALTDAQYLGEVHRVAADRREALRQERVAWMARVRADAAE